jgi:acetyl esterase
VGDSHKRDMTTEPLDPGPLDEGHLDPGPLDEGMAAFSKAVSEALPPGFEQLPLAQQRAQWDALCRSFRAPRPANITVQDIDINGVPTRLFRPNTTDPVAGVIYGHGGGFVLGSPETHDDMCAEMAAGANAAVALFNYHKAPEHPFPAQLEDSMTIYNWMRRQGRDHGIDPDHLIAAGDSAGGQMSAALALHLRAQNLPQLKAMVLIYPGLGASFSSPSYERNADSKSLSRDEMLYYWRSFLGPEGNPNWKNELALPLLARDLSNLPPAFITAAWHDPLYDDGVTFHQRLLKAGVASTLRTEPALAHSYMRARNHSAPAKEAFAVIVQALKHFSAPVKR